MKAASTVLCNNILFRGMTEGVKITPMKLQKLMYFVCRDYVKKLGESPISEQFEVWQYGPVLPSVYSEFKPFGKRGITEFARDAKRVAYKVNEESNPTLGDTIDKIWRRYKHKSGVELSQITHQKNSGWYRAYSEKRLYITDEDMRCDYAE